MAGYDTGELERKALEAIDKYRLFFIEDIVTYLPCSKKTFYNHGLHELHSIKEALHDNRIRTKSGIRKKWYDGDNVTAQIALYRLIGSAEELKRLNTRSVELSGIAGDSIKVETEIDYKKLSPEDLEKLIEIAERQAEDE